MEMSLLPTNRIVREGEIADELRVLDVNVCMVGSTLINGFGNDEDYLCLLYTSPSPRDRG